MSQADCKSFANAKLERVPWPETFVTHPAILMFVVNLVLIILYLVSEAAIIAPRPEGDELNGIDEKLMWLTTSFPLLLVGFLANAGWLVFWLKKRIKSVLTWSLLCLAFLGWIAAVYGYGSFAADMFTFFRIMIHGPTNS